MEVPFLRLELPSSTLQPPNPPLKAKISPEWAKCLVNFADYSDSVIGSDFDDHAQPVFALPKLSQLVFLTQINAKLTPGSIPS